MEQRKKEELVVLRLMEVPRKRKTRLPRNAWKDTVNHVLVMFRVNKKMRMDRR